MDVGQPDRVGHQRTLTIRAPSARAITPSAPSGTRARQRDRASIAASSSPPACRAGTSAGRRARRSTGRCSTRCRRTARCRRRGPAGRSPARGRPTATGTSAEKSTSQRSDHSTLSTCWPVSVTNVASCSGSDHPSAEPCHRSQPSSSPAGRRTRRYCAVARAMAATAGTYRRMNRLPTKPAVRRGVDTSGACQDVAAEHEEDEHRLAAGPHQVQRRVGHRPLEAGRDPRLLAERVGQPAAAQGQVVGDDHGRGDAAHPVEPAPAHAWLIGAGPVGRRGDDRRAHLGHPLDCRRRATSGQQ